VKMQFQEQTDKGMIRYVPYVVAEPSVGVGRILLAIIAEGYTEETVKGRKRIVLKIHPRLAPFDVAVFPLQKDEQILVKSKKIFTDLRSEGLTTYFDDGGSIGKRYRRQDEIGTPFCITIDFESLEDDQVTVRDRDTMEQRRILINSLAEELRGRIKEYS